MGDTKEITIESITSTVEKAEDLTPEQKTFLETNKADLEPDVADKYGIKQDPIVPPLNADGSQKTPEQIKAEEDAAAAGKGGKGGESEDPDPEDVAVIEKIVAKHIGPIKAAAEAQRIETDIQSELGKHPEYKPYEKQIRAFVTHENRIKFIQNGLPVSSVVLEAIAPYLQKIGAEKERIAREKADTTHSGGSTARQPAGAAKDWHTASAEEVAAQREKIFGHK